MVVLDSHILEAKRVLTLEAQALQNLSESITSDFSEAVKLIANTKGRVICTGIGKSGHIARKISSMLASTGTTSSFVHPSEASHGDLGMITKHDLIISLSNSGNTSELSDILLHAQRCKVHIIGMTSNAVSTLATVSSVALVLPEFEEACPLGLAPTTSTTMMLALGDALATAVLKVKNFSAHDFSFLHPGGSLGQKLLRVKSLMHKAKELPIVSIDDNMHKAVEVISQKGCGCVGVIDKKNIIIGIVTDGDIRRNLNENILKMSIKDVMAHNPITVVPDTTIEEALKLMNDHSITMVFIVNSSITPIGILHMHDCLRAKFN